MVFVFLSREFVRHIFTPYVRGDRENIRVNHILSQHLSRIPGTIACLGGVAAPVAGWRDVSPFSLSPVPDQTNDQPTHEYMARKDTRSIVTTAGRQDDITTW